MYSRFYAPSVSLFAALLTPFLCNATLAASGPKDEKGVYTEPKVFALRPNETKEREFGSVGASGLLLRIYPGVVLKVEGTMSGSPAAGRFKVGEIIIGVNGKALSGKNPFVALGMAVTEAEATDGKLVFDVVADGNRKRVAVKIPVLGAYSETWPLNCEKSKAIIENAKAYYSSLDFSADEPLAPSNDATTHGVGGALVNLFLLSTGDDSQLPKVRAYLEYFVKNRDSIGYHTWNNGYNGIVCAEYYLRTGDASVLPVLQYYCDAARDTQFFGVGWKHWGTEINPRYTAGGLMNPAGCQNLTTLLLAKSCGVKVDQKTLHGALQYWYRFAGRGTVPYGDHRGEGGLGSNGKDGMAAAAMQVALGSKGNTAIYREARDCFAMSMLSSYTRMVTGHADNGRGDGIWRGISSAYMLDEHPNDYHQVMNKLQWWYDLSRRPGGGFGLSACVRFNDLQSGAGAAMAYTAPLKTLQITGAPRSQHAAVFSLPEGLWGRPADRAFLSIEHGKPYGGLGENRPIHEILTDLGTAYSRERSDIDSVPVDLVRENVYHKRFVVRTQAAKALCKMRQFGELEHLIEDPDPRVRRAGLDGLSDYRYWFALGKRPIDSDDFSPKTVELISGILADSNESWFVIDGALLALSRAPANAITEILDLITPYTTHEEWWLRQSAFLALAGATSDRKAIPKVLPVMLETMIKENRPMARQWMNNVLNKFLAKHEASTPEGRMVVEALMRSAETTEILSGNREGEGGYFASLAVVDALKHDPEQALKIAEIVKQRFTELNTRWFAKVVPALLEALDALPEEKKAALEAELFDVYRVEMLRRLNADENVSLDTLVSLTKLKFSDVGWQPLGRINPAARVWRYTSFDCLDEEELHPREQKRFRNVTLPHELENWFMRSFDDSNWHTGKAPIGVGVFHHRRKKNEFLPNQSDWGKGEFLVMRGDIQLESADYDFYRLRVLANQGYDIYINGEKVCTYVWWKNEPEYRPVGLSKEANSHVRKGRNIIAVYANCAYPDQGPAVGQIDVRIEGLRKSDLERAQ